MDPEHSSSTPPPSTPPPNFKPPVSPSQQPAGDDAPTEKLVAGPERAAAVGALSAAPASLHKPGGLGRFSRNQVIAATSALAVMVGLWGIGTFDKALADYGLNAHDCGRNGLGVTFCGDELKQYEENLKKLDAEMEQSAAEAKAELQKASEEAQAEAEQAAAEADARYEESMDRLDESYEDAQDDAQEQLDKLDEQMDRDIAQAEADAEADYDELMESLDE